jgi:diguanylate cyclase (GGDEF)-like protein
MATFLATERSAITDGLTGLYNRPFFDASLRRELKRARRYGLAFSLVMLDLDDFKMVNDLHGHVVGDEALARLSDVIRASVREIDVACRYGGEEFALFFLKPAEPALTSSPSVSGWTRRTRSIASLSARAHRLRSRCR